MITELREKIATKGNGITELTGGFWYLEAPQTIIYPYAVFSFITNNFGRDSKKKFEEIYLQINIYDEDAENIEVIKDSIIYKFDDSEATFLLQDYYFDRIERQFIRAFTTDVFQITLQYKINLTKK